ncbi:MAG: triphosphoribosyl-dephospho-CoA synthase [Alphaproteobacteria bacterium GM7ARS4]|nr:triphosphoribosyl-dephospho-CoA synthase [Alphaproteobacteria bacterium GM7ARS4]
MSRAIDPYQIQHAFLWATLSELEALKVGNVHLYKEGHGLAISTFVQSAYACAPIMARPSMTVGARIMESCIATHNAVRTNSNLGIILLCACIASATHRRQCSPTLRDALRHTLSHLTIDDAQQAYRAIRLMAPSGMGHVATHDIAINPSITLAHAMHLSKDRDRIAYQYDSCFQDVYDIAIPFLQAHRCHSTQPHITRHTIAMLHLTLLASIQDSHIARQHGTLMAQTIQERAARLLTDAAHTPAFYQRLLAWDHALKQRHINPGTTADMLVASLMLFFIEHMHGR